ncbi:Transcriptional activator Myb [Galdieria sulphuraria]|uniref:MYB-related protein n=1 Tax=Galdieria sulphuraria TaxID=130081 RepID=M2Y2P6_GALSU|nr:MYB-related protein [Galdieria sulphuraria]EME30218.1 MYB-related protein [Galdieria sulphuraria]GJD08386.1 Transcriptional activator Myb [Galdieria sulphuraria]|eukprot:XP_005706738.1 MYB-related protein [Galdieria sulphuraria]
MTVVVPEKGESKATNVMFDSKSLFIQKLENQEGSLGSLGWTEQEDRRLVELHRKYGNRWALIKKFMGGKTGQQCLKRWRYTLDPTVRKDSWTKEETERLMKLHEELGSKWSDIARKLGTGRTDIQCRYRYFRVLAGKATNTVSRDASRLYRTYSVCDSSTVNEEMGCKYVELPSSMQRRSSDPGSSVEISFVQSENISIPEMTEVSHSLGSGLNERALNSRERCTQHSHYGSIGQEQTGTLDRFRKEDLAPTVCPDCGIARVRPLHSVPVSRVAESNYASYSCLNASSLSDKGQWVALDSMMGLTRDSLQFESLRNVPRTTLPLFRDRSRNEEASFNSLMGVCSTISGASEMQVTLNGDFCNILPPLHMSRMNTFGAKDDNAMMESCNLPPLWDS